MQKADNTIQDKISNTSKEYSVENGLVYRNGTDKSGLLYKQIVVPEKLRNDILKLGHESKMSGHLGNKKSLERIRNHFFWPGMTADVKKFCSSCDLCQKTIPKGRVTKSPLGRMPLIDVPFKRVAVDIIGPMCPKSEDGHRYILTVIDYATRYPEATPLKGCTSEEVAEGLLSIFSRVGLPQEILTDHGRQFTAEYMKELMKLLEINHLITTPYHPMCNGLVENINGVLKQMLRKLCTEQPKSWNKLIDPLLFAYREVPQESTGFSPFELLYGRTVRGPLQLLKELWTENIDQDTRNTYEYVINLKDKLESTMEFVKKNLEKAQNRHKFYYDRRSKESKIEFGDKVLILLPTNINKLIMKWKGPYTVAN